MFTLLVLMCCVNASFLRECVYIDEKCEQMVGCEYSELNTCLVRTEPNPKSKLLLPISYTLSTDGKTLRTDLYNGVDNCVMDKENHMSDLVPLQLNTCVAAKQPPFKKVVAIVDSLEKDEKKPIAFFTNSSLGLSENAHCDKVSVIEAMFNGCTSFPDGSSAMYRIRNNKLLCEAFSDTQCIAYRETILEQQCETCFSEKIGDDVYQYRHLRCDLKFIQKEKLTNDGVLDDDDTLNEEKVMGGPEEKKQEL